MYGSAGFNGLEQLARDSPSDHPAVFDVLTAFVRGQVPAGTGKCTDPTCSAPRRSVNAGLLHSERHLDPLGDLTPFLRWLGR
jgi:hypothetical protein